MKQEFKEFNLQNHWVVIEVLEQVDGSVDVYVEPGTLHLRSGFVGNIIWQVFTPGWMLDPEVGVIFDDGCGFEGQPQPDATRTGCWSTAASNDEGIKKAFPYHVTVVSRANPATALTVDPVVENDPPPPTFPPLTEVERRRRRGNA